MKAPAGRVKEDLISCSKSLRLPPTTRSERRPLLADDPLQWLAVSNGVEEVHDGSLAPRLRACRCVRATALLRCDYEPADEVDVVFGDDRERLGCGGWLEAEFSDLGGDCLGLGEGMVG